LTNLLAGDQSAIPASSFLILFNPPIFEEDYSLDRKSLTFPGVRSL
jgi:hypothetical protein